MSLKKNFYQMKRFGGNSTLGHTCFQSIDNNEMFKPNVSPQCAVFTLFSFEDPGGGKFTLLFLHSSSSLSSCRFFFCLFVCFNVFFNRALFFQCSHVTSMQSPYVLNSNVVSYRRILHKPLS